MSKFTVPPNVLHRQLKVLYDLLNHCRLPMVQLRKLTHIALSLLYIYTTIRRTIPSYMINKENTNQKTSIAYNGLQDQEKVLQQTNCLTQNRTER